MLQFLDTTLNNLKYREENTRDIPTIIGNEERTGKNCKGYTRKPTTFAQNNYLRSSYASRPVTDSASTKRASSGKDSTNPDRECVLHSSDSHLTKNCRDFLSMSVGNRSVVKDNASRVNTARNYDQHQILDEAFVASVPLIALTAIKQNN